MTKAFDIKKMVDRKQTWHNSLEYRTLCKQYQKECERLTLLAGSAGLDLDTVVKKAEQAVVCTESAVNGTIHRGVYCPSPIQDLIVGNLKRGKILKRVTPKSRITHQYGFDATHRLVYSRFVSSGVEINTEYLIYGENLICGVTLDTHGFITAISEERYRGDLLMKYTYVQYLPCEVPLTCVDYRCEEYTYGENVLCACDVRTFHPFAQIHSHEVYRFFRTDGSLSGYTMEEYQGDERVTGFWDDHLFEIKEK